MIVDIVMPKMGESITEGTILEWRKNVGDTIELDEILLEIGTDKVDSEIPSPTPGVLVEIIGKPNQVMDVGAIIARVETDSKAVNPSDSKFDKNLSNAEPEIDQGHEQESAPKLNPQITTPVSIPVEKKFFTPVVNKIALENGIGVDVLMTIPGSGAGGRVTKVDILAYLKTKSKVSSPAKHHSSETKTIPHPSSNPIFTGREARVEMDHMRKLIADHMRASIDTSAHVYVITEVDMTNIKKFVDIHNDDFTQKEGYSLTYTPFIVDACVKALMIHPEMNSSLDGSSIIYHKNVNIGMAVAVDKGLMVPVIGKCEELNFLGICRKVKDLAQRTRNKQLKADELQGSTFSISNFGVFNVTMGTPIINQPNVGILGVGAVKKRPVVIETSEGDTIGIKSMMYLTLGFDHRLVDGAGGSQFIETVRHNLETMKLESLI